MLPRTCTTQWCDKVCTEKACCNSANVVISGVVIGNERCWVFQMATAVQRVAKSSLEGRVEKTHPGQIPLSCDLAPPLEALIRMLIAQARNGSGAFAGVNNDRRGRVIIDTEVDGVRCLLTHPAESPSSRISFSPRQHEIACMVAKGYPNKTIAAVLKISSWTVCTHLRRMFAKLGVSSRAAMVARMMDAGMLAHTDEPRKKSMTL